MKIFIAFIFFIFPAGCYCLEIKIGCEKKVIENSDGEKIFYYYPFEINGQSFLRINGNERDEGLSDLFNAEPSIEFVLETNTKQHRASAPICFAQGLSRCITQGLCSIIQMDTNPKKYCRDFNIPNGAISQLTPPCDALAAFLESGVVVYPQLFRNFITKDADISNLENFSSIELHDENGFVHEAIHIFQGICISKIGLGAIFFQSIHDLIEFYKRRNKEIYIKKPDRNNDDKPFPPPDASGACVAT